MIRVGWRNSGRLWKGGVLVRKSGGLLALNYHTPVDYDRVEDTNLRREPVLS